MRGNVNGVSSRHAVPVAMYLEESPATESNDAAG
jgi:hypothetical protein